MEGLITLLVVSYQLVYYVEVKIVLKCLNHQVLTSVLVVVYLAVVVVVVVVVVVAVRPWVRGYCSNLQQLVVEEVASMVSTHSWNFLALTKGHNLQIQMCLLSLLSQSQYNHSSRSTFIHCSINH